MTTNEIIKLLSERLGCSQVKAKKTFVATMETFKGIIQKEGIFSLPKYGTFKVKKKKKRKLFNPKKKVYLPIILGDLTFAILFAILASMGISWFF